MLLILTNDIMSLLDIDKIMERVERCSYSYLPDCTDENYESTLRKCNIKISHTRGVIDIASNMATETYHCTPYEIKLIVCSAAVHDIPGRDKQNFTYGTWIDKNCPEDHGDIGYTLLVANNYALIREITDVDLTDADCEIISNVVKYHCKANYDEVNDSLTKKILDIIVSADGIDLFRSRIEDTWDIVFSGNAPTESEVAKSVFSPKLLQAFLNLKPGEVLNFSSKTNPIRENPLNEHYVDAIILNYAIANKSNNETRRTILSMHYIDLLYERYINVAFSAEVKEQLKQVYNYARYLINHGLKE